MGVTSLWRPRHFFAVVALAAVAVVVSAWSIGRGDYPMGIGDVFAVVVTGGGTRLEHLVVFDWRMPRAATALAVGAALGISGALTQSVTRNPLASPDILGVTDGASAAAVTVIIVGTGTGATGTGLLAGIGVSAAAVGGAVAAALAIWAIAWRGGVDTFRMVLAGIVIAALLKAWITYLLVQANIEDAATAKFWLAGSLATASWQRLIPITVLLVVVAAGAGVAARVLKALALGDDTATALGTGTAAAQVALLAVAALLAAAATATAGPIAFVAFVAPQTALRLTGAATPPLVASAVTGGIIIALADIAVQWLPNAMPVGLITSPIGGLFLLYLLINKNRKTTS
nr:iron chelate uptake ABC transporter family permease subunit [Corynebacterium mendelii]